MIVKSLQWIARRHWTVKVLALLILAVSIGGPAAVCPPIGRWWDLKLDEAFGPLKGAA